MKCGWINLMELGTVTVTSAETDYPAYRAYDRLFGRMWKATSTSTQTWHIDQGSSPISFDTLIIPSGHVLSGCGMTFESCDDDSSWAPLVTGWTEPVGGLWIKKQAAVPTNDRYVRIVISGASVSPEAGEVFVTLLNSLTSPLYGAKSTRKANAARNEGFSGQPRFVVNGTSVKIFNYTVSTQDTAEIAVYSSWFQHWADYRRPFFVEDHAGGNGFYEFSDEPSLAIDLSTIATLNLQQVF